MHSYPKIMCLKMNETFSFKKISDFFLVDSYMYIYLYTYGGRYLGNKLLSNFYIF
jgi:hypothetical protein